MQKRRWGGGTEDLGNLQKAGGERMVCKRGRTFETTGCKREGRQRVSRGRLLHRQAVGGMGKLPHFPSWNSVTFL